MLLATGEVAALVADDGVKAVDLVEDELFGVSEQGSLVDLLVTRIELTVANVIFDGVVKEESVLADEADLVAQRGLSVFLCLLYTSPSPRDFG